MGETSTDGSESRARDQLHRWDSASHAGTSWAGHELPAVQIDTFGKFPYVLVKLSDRLAGSKLLVRGKNGRSEMQLVSSVTKEVHSFAVSMIDSDDLCRHFHLDMLCAWHSYTAMDRPANMHTEMDATGVANA